MVAPLGAAACPAGCWLSSGRAACCWVPLLVAGGAAWEGKAAFWPGHPGSVCRAGGFVLHAGALLRRWRSVAEPCALINLGKQSSVCSAQLSPQRKTTSLEKAKLLKIDFVLLLLFFFFSRECSSVLSRAMKCLGRDAMKPLVLKLPVPGGAPGALCASSPALWRCWLLRAAAACGNWGNWAFLVPGRSLWLCATRVRLVPAGNKALGTPAVARAGSSLLHCFCTATTAAEGQHFQSLRSRFWGRKRSIASQRVPRIVPRFPPA